MLKKITRSPQTENTGGNIEIHHVTAEFQALYAVHVQTLTSLLGTFIRTGKFSFEIQKTIMKIHITSFRCYIEKLPFWPSS